MNNTIDFKTAKTIDSMSKKLDHIDDAVTGFFSIMHMAMENDLGSAEPYFAATSPVLDLTVIRPDDAPHILACFDEADEGIGISENEPLGFRYAELGCYASGCAGVGTDEVRFFGRSGITPYASPQRPGEHHRVKSVPQGCAACIEKCRTKGLGALPNKHFATQKVFLYRRKHCLHRLCVLSGYKHQSLRKTKRPPAVLVCTVSDLFMYVLAPRPYRFAPFEAITSRYHQPESFTIRCWVG